MNLKRVFMLLFLSLAAVLCVSPMIAARADTSIIRVPSDFPTIQDAINAAQNGSTILVDSGVYYEHLTVNKSLTLLGAGEKDTIVDGSNSTNDAIVITADNVLLDGFTARNSVGYGIRLVGSTGSIVSHNVATLDGFAGIELVGCSNDTVSENIVSWTIGSSVGVIYGYGIMLATSANNTISNNVIAYIPGAGIVLDQSDNNTIVDNACEDSGVIIEAVTTKNNVIFQNNFINTSDSGSHGNNTWSVGGKGNYWDDYTGLDDGSGGRVAGNGVGDTNLPWHGVDYYPLINPVNPLQVFWDNTVFPVSLVSNSTVSTFNFDQADREVTFNVNGPANTTGYFNLSTPTALLSGPWKVLLDGTDITPEAVITENQTYTSIYLNYNHSTHSIQIIGTSVIPEYPMVTVFPFLTLAAILLLTVLAAEKRKKNKQTSICKLQITFFSSNRSKLGSRALT